MLGGFTHLLLDVAVGHRDWTGRPVQEVLVGGHLALLHGGPAPSQLLWGDTARRQHEQPATKIFCHGVGISEQRASDSPFSTFS